MTIAEGNIAHRQKFEILMLSKQTQLEMIKKNLNFRNEKFKIKCAELIYWMNFVLDPPSACSSLSTSKFTNELKEYLSALQRYESDLLILVEDVNRQSFFYFLFSYLFIFICIFLITFLFLTFFKK